MNLVKFVFLQAALGLVASAAFAQFQGGTPGGVNAAFARLFGTNAAFSAKVDVQVLDDLQKETLRMPMNFAVLGDNIRVETDLSRAKSKALSPKGLAEFKQMGLDRVTSVIRPDKKAMYLVYPGAQGYIEETAEPAGADLKINRTALARETVDGHASVKNRVVMKNGKGEVLLDAVVWNASDMNDFPVQIATKENADTTILRFQQVQFVRPDLKLFEAPAGFTKYLSPQALMYAASQKTKGSAK